jgi:hypothetical protein
MLRVFKEKIRLMRGLFQLDLLSFKRNSAHDNAVTFP